MTTDIAATPLPWPKPTDEQISGGWHVHCDFLADVIREGGDWAGDLYLEQVEAVLMSPSVLSALSAPAPAEPREGDLVEGLFGKVYANVVIKYDPDAARKCLREALAGHCESGQNARKILADLVDALPTQWSVNSTTARDARDRAIAYLAAPRPARPDAGEAVAYQWVSRFHPDSTHPPLSYDLPRDKSGYAPRPLYAHPPAASAAAALVAERDAIHAALSNELAHGAYDCTRVWEAWSVGTMSGGDFVLVSERLNEIVDSVASAIDGPATAFRAEVERIANNHYPPQVLDSPAALKAMRDDLFTALKSVQPDETQEHSND